jgi:hypothetical protein
VQQYDGFSFAIDLIIQTGIAYADIVAGCGIVAIACLAAVTGRRDGEVGKTGTCAGANMESYFTGAERRKTFHREAGRGVVVHIYLDGGMGYDQFYMEPTIGVGRGGKPVFIFAGMSSP